MKKFIFALYLIFATVVCQGVESAFCSLDSLIEAFGALPKNREGATKYSSGFAVMFPKKEDQVAEFKRVVGSWMRMRADHMNDVDVWERSNLGTKQPESWFFNPLIPNKEFVPYVEKIDVAPGHRYFLRGDLHGDISSLIQQLKEMKIQGLIDNQFKLKPGVTMGFLGDYVDRGNYGLEVLYTLAILGIKNPNNVLCVRGNHEDLNISARYGFKSEVAAKFADKNGELHAWIGRMYDYMPVAVFLKDSNNNCLLLCHGGLEQGYRPEDFLQSSKKYQLIGALHRAKSVKDLLADGTVCSSVKKAMSSLLPSMKDNVVLQHPCDSDLPLGFMWNDFDPTGKNPEVIVKPGRGLQYGQLGADAVLHQQGGSKINIIGVIRAHQHAADPRDPMMKNIENGGGVWNMRGCGCDLPIGADKKHKDVYTLNVSPDGDYGIKVGFDDDVAVEVIPDAYKPWVIKKHKYYQCKQDFVLKSDFAGLQKAMMITVVVLSAVISYYGAKSIKNQKHA